EVAVDTPHHLDERIQVELVPDVAVRKRVVQLEVVDVKRTIGERIALVRIVILVLGQHVVPLELEPAAQPLPHSDGKAVVQRLAQRARRKNAAELRKEPLPRVIQKPSQVHALRMRKVDIHREAVRDLLLEGNVQGVYARICIVLAEYANACARGYRTRWT